jgi:hypothetical protein
MSNGMTISFVGLEGASCPTVWIRANRSGRPVLTDFTRRPLAVDNDHPLFSIGLLGPASKRLGSMAVAGRDRTKAAKVRPLVVSRSCSGTLAETAYGCALNFEPGTV